MRRNLIVLLFFCIAVSAVSADAKIIPEPPFFPQSAEVMAQGGSFNANGSGFYSFFSNPASYAGEKSSLTIVSLMPWIYAYPDPDVIAALAAMAEDPASGIAGLNDLLTGPGFGAGGSTGAGYVGNGLGLGLVGMADLYGWGPKTLGINVDGNITVGFVGGFALPIRIGGLTLKIGGDFRPMYRIRVPELGISTFASMLSGGSEDMEIDVPVYHGVGLAIDAGTIVEFGPFAAGIALRDLFGTTFQYSTSTLTELVDALEAGSLPEGGELVGEDVRYMIPMSAQVGLAFHPRLGALSKIVDPIVHANFERSFMPGAEDESFWASLHAGAEVSFLSMLKLRAGINQGYITAGVGLHLLFLDLNVAYFGRELGSFAGSRQNQGITMELALRF
ncbi:MAG: hypothetical protein JW852_08050 [Spirochaetales bacterium]|nr:hypothetical protein [Spirochaetales bacterium]